MAISRATATRSASCSRCPGLKYAVLNADDAFAATIAADLPPGCTLVRTSVRSSAVELSARLKRSDLSGLELDIAGKFGAGRLASKLIGAFNAENLLSALGALRRARHDAAGGVRGARRGEAGAGPHGSARRAADGAVGRRRLRAHARRAARAC